MVAELGMSHTTGESLKNKKFIGVAWPYVNGELHIGHFAGYLLPADICARYLRATGNDVLLVSGSDCFGTPITIEAEKRGITPREIVDLYHSKDVHLFRDVLGLTYDMYTKTDNEQHIRTTQDVFVTLLKNGYIFVDTTKQYYSSGDKKFLPDRYVEGKCKNCGFAEARSDQCDNCGKVLEQNDLENPHSKLNGKGVELKDTEHYFLDWPKLQPQIESYVRKVGPNWKPWIYQETLGWLKKGLKPRAISRDINWGVPLPVDRIPENMKIKNMDHKRLYVWFEAVIGYLSASELWSKEGGGDWKEFWYNQDSHHYYFMGKDNLIFHTIFWPGQLMGYDQDLHLPDTTSVNMFLDLEGKQFSKSRGVSIPIEDIVNQYGNDPVRFYLTLIMPELRDSSFTWTDFVQKNKDVLVGNFGNFVHRILSFAKGIDIQEVSKYGLSEESTKEIEKAFAGSRRFLENCQFKNYLDSILKLSDYGNKYIQLEHFWTLKKDNPEKLLEVMKQLYSLIISLGYLALPLLPETSKNIFKLLGLEPQTIWPEIGKEIESINILSTQIDTSTNPTPLFKKIDLPEGR